MTCVTTLLWHPNVHLIVCIKISRSSARVVYRLMSVIVHTGDANCGHYVTYRRTSGYKWSVSSDERVRSVSLDHVLHTSAYMIFYEKKT